MDQVLRCIGWYGLSMAIFDVLQDWPLGLSPINAVFAQKLWRVVKVTVVLNALKWRVQLEKAWLLTRLLIVARQPLPFDMVHI